MDFHLGPIFRLGVTGGLLILFLVLELSGPYRPPTVSKLKRWFDNLALTALNTVILHFIFGAAAIQTAIYATNHNLGVLNLAGLPLWVKFMITIAFLDFMLYVWHLLNHEMPFLWRFHRVHHSDLNMDVSTATRFHLGELLISAVIKIALIFFIGAEPKAVILFETLLVAAAQFHHSSLKVPERFERWWHILFVPPSMHRIHHSVKIRERDSNYGTIFSLWDRFLGTLVRNVDQAKIVIGVGGHFDFRKVGLLGLWAMPFRKAVR